MSEDLGIVGERGRIGTALATVLGPDGEEIKFDIREDEEQSVRLAEAIQLLVAAGYFRARIRGLSAFDKVVGGMVWCISLCNVDVDVDLFYQENSTIGQKIALTEKIVEVLPQLRCPAPLQPHQIQGLDAISIYPVLKWLVSAALEAKAEGGDSLKAYAEYHFRRRFPKESELEAARKAAIVQQALKASSVTRLFRKTAGTSGAEGLPAQARVTLMEYGLRSGGTVGAGASEDEEVATDEQEPVPQTTVEELGGRRIRAGLVTSLLDTSSIVAAAASYRARETERGGDAIAENREEVEEELAQLKGRLEQLRAQEAEERAAMEASVARQREVKDEASTLSALRQHVQELEEAMEPAALEELRSLMAQHEDSRRLEKDFKERCKGRMAEMEADHARLTALAAKDDEEGEAALSAARAAAEKAGRKWDKGRLALAGLNKEVAGLQRALDEVPSQAELQQYQRRFLELYDQIGRKHAETKTFYALYNELSDRRDLMGREVQLLNSVIDAYPRAAESESGKAELGRQLEEAVSGIGDGLARSERRLGEARQRRDAARDAGDERRDNRRLFYKTVADFHEACAENEELQSRLRVLEDAS